MQVLILSPFFRPNIGGVETHLTDLTEHLRKKHYKVHVVTYTPLTTNVDGVPAREVAKNLDVHRVKWPGRGIYFLLERYFILHFLYLFPALFFYSMIFMLRHKIHVIHAHGLLATAIADILGKIFKTKVVMSVHGIYNLKQRPVYRRFVRLILLPVNQILVLSARSKKDFLATGISKNKFAIYTHWVDQDIFKPPHDKYELKRKMGFHNDFVVLFVGRLLQSKGIKTLLTVAERLPLDVKLLFVGTGPMENEILKACQQRSNIRFVGKISVEKLVYYYGVADLVVVPSQNEEGFARVVLESLSCGVPLIAANKGCLLEMIKPSVGKLMEPTPERLYEEILSLQQNREEVELMAANCRSYALESFSERNAALIEEVYQNG